MVKRHSRERRDSDAPSKTPKSNKSESEQSTKPVKNFLLQFRRDKRSRSSQNSGRFGQRSSGTSDKRQSGTSDKNQNRMSASGKRVHNGNSPRRKKKIQRPPKKKSETTEEENISASGKRVRPQRNKSEKEQAPPKKRRKTITVENAIEVILGAYEFDDEERAIVKEGGIELILNTMKRRKENGRVQKNGCAALWDITNENDDPPERNCERGWYQGDS